MESKMSLLDGLFQPTVVIYHFLGEPITESVVPIEEKILSSIQRNNTGLLFYRTEGIFKGRCFTLEKHPVYRLKSRTHHSQASFYLYDYEGGLACDVLMLATDTLSQGNGIKLKDFVNRLAKTLFDADNIVLLHGTAMANTNSVLRKPNTWKDFRCEKTRDGTPKLVKLYQHLGFSRLLNSDEVFMTYEAFTAASTGRRASPSSQRPNNLLDANMSRLR